MACGSHLKCDSSNYSQKAWEQTQKHPCYSADAHHKYARMHLPVAPKCNISCNYCNRKFDCMNESRPGVTSQVLTPDEALYKYGKVKEKIDQLTVVGIAGPGDALANWKQTKKTISLIKDFHNDTHRQEANVKQEEAIFCLSTNGLMLSLYADEIIAMGINHVTITINAIDAEIGAQIYKYILWNGLRYTGKAAAEILIDSQLAGLKRLAENGVMVKVNIVMISGVNDKHIPEVVKKVKSLGAFMTNIMPLIPAAGSAFEHHPQTSMKEIEQMRKLCELDVMQMRHCKQCRADAVGLLGQDRSIEFRDIVKKTDNAGSADYITVPVSDSQNTAETIYKIAVATKSGKVVDLHFGHADVFSIYQCNIEGDEKGSIRLLEKREVEAYCNGEDDCGEDRRKKVIEMLSDCHAVLSIRIGYAAEQSLKQHGIRSFQHYEMIDAGLLDVVEKLRADDIVKSKIEIAGTRMKGGISHGETGKTHICL